VEELGQALQRVDVLRKEVIANVSHELIAPLSLIIGYVEMVRDITWTDDERRESNLNLISREAGRLSQMVDDIMDYSQFQAGCAKLNKTVCNLYEIVEQEVALERQIASEYAIQVSLDSFSSEITIRADALKISQVIRNLLNNAVNHTANGESIRVYVTREENCVKVSVANPGKPIPEEDRELIWERYRRVQHQGGRRQGTGIGLAIVSTILTAHEMSYGVECTDSENVFWFAYL
jgi:signal transduction histidine kinase